MQAEVWQVPRPISPCLYGIIRDYHILIPILITMVRMTLLAGYVMIHSMIYQSGTALFVIYSDLAVIPW